MLKIGEPSVTENEDKLNFNIFINNFYEKLRLSQEPLDEKFEKILHDNLWDLYET